MDALRGRSLFALLYTLAGAVSLALMYALGGNLWTNLVFTLGLPWSLLFTQLGLVTAQSAQRNGWLRSSHRRQYGDRLAWRGSQRHAVGP